VVINGADINAGSKRNRRNKNGSAEPETEAKTEIATRLLPTAIATGKFFCRKKAQIVAIAPSMIPNNLAWQNLLEKTTL